MSDTGLLPAATGPEPWRVLYIEDEPLNAVLMREVFRDQAGWSLQVASDGQEGLALLRQWRPHLALIDMHLPYMDGLAILRQVRADPTTARLPCVALSADALPEQIQTALGAGFDHYWTKPVDLLGLMPAIQKLLLGRA